MDIENISAPPKRTQEQRSASTQQALLLAARDTISELGYNKTTVVEVSRRAGVSRGAQLHHYQTKEIMMLAVADFIFSGVEHELTQIADQLANSQGDVDHFIDDIWRQIFCEENFHPIMELVSAARTDTILRALLAERWKRLINTYDAIWAKVLNHRGHQKPELAMVLNLTLSLLRGMAFQRVIDDTDPCYYTDMLNAWSLIVKSILGKEPLQGLKLI